MKYFKKFFNWIWLSSANPKEVSLTVKSALVAIIPTVIHLATVACGFGLVCLGADNASLEKVVSVISDVIFWSLSIVSGIGFVIGFLRKSFLTVTGKNKAI